jgi:hypothetical protein
LSFRQKLESSEINYSWMPDQVRHDDLRVLISKPSIFFEAENLKETTLTLSQPYLDDDDDVILLTDVVEPDEISPLPPEKTAEQAGDEVIVSGVEEAPDDQTAEVYQNPQDDPQNAAAVAPIPEPQVSEAQIEAALERVITRLYGEKIERVLHEVAHEKITRDMERIKNLILEEPPLDS